ncbi:MAG: DUF2283 domain-containing protein [Candidatus Pacearchaeota archaeon]|nr:DUF2283 domain-containing protein [Candidatus Pacearchaeota archaeon]
MEKYNFDYDADDDVLYIQNAVEEVEESVEFSEDIVIDLDKKGGAIGIEVFYASEFFNLFNKNINKDFLENLEDAHIEYKEFRNVFFIILVLKSKNQVIRQPMPPLRKSEYSSPLIAN